MATVASPQRPAVAKPGTASQERRWLEVVSHTDPRYGGLSSSVPALAAAIERSAPVRIAFAAFCHAGEAYRPGELQEEQVTFWSTSRKAWLVERGLNASFEHAVQQADALHVHGLWEQSTATACGTARRLGKPYILSAHGMLEPWALAAKGFKKRMYAALVERKNVTRANCLHALTVAEAEQYRAFGARGPIAVVPNAVHLPAEADPALFLERFPQLSGKRLVLFLSRLHPKKGLDLLVQAWASVAPLFPDAHLVIAGPDSEGMQAKLTHEVAQGGIGARVTFTGMLNGALKWSALRAAELYVLPSYSEGLSMALLEAMGMGLPVIATRACNMPEISTAEAGWEIDATASALTSSLGEVLRRAPAQNWEQGRRGAQLIASRYTPTQVARQMAAVYAFVLGGSQPECIHSGGVR
jgi:glycosyltransferase involved in cell wall biosynthesis